MKNNSVQKNIPNQWRASKLGYLAVLKKGEQLNRLDMIDSGEFYALNGGISPSGNTDKWNTEANTITISEGGNSCGFVSFNRRRFWCGGHCYAITNIKKGIDRDFLYQLLKNSENEIMRLRVGSGLPNIQKKNLIDFDLIIPPISEQKKISSILSTVDEGIQKTDEIIVATERLKNGLMQELFSKGIGHTKFKKTKIGSIPVEWEMVKGSDITRLITKGSSPKWQGFDYQKEGTLFITSENVRDGLLDISNPKFLPPQFHEKLKNSQLKNNDILINIVGASIGRSCLYESAYTCANINQAVCLMRLNSKVLPLFILHFLQNKQTIQRLLDSQTGSARQNLSLTDIRGFIFVQPTLDEQNRITEILNVLVEKISINKSIKRKLTILKYGLMQELLSGTKRVQSLMYEDSES